MVVGKRTRAAARVVGSKLDAITSALRGIVVALVVLAVAVIGLAVRTL